MFIRVVVTVPPGEIGMEVADADTGPIRNTVGEVDEDGPLAGKVLPGDRIISVNGTQVHQQDAAEILELLRDSEEEKKITLAREVDTKENGGGVTYALDNDEETDTVVAAPDTPQDGRRSRRLLGSFVSGEGAEIPKDSFSMLYVADRWQDCILSLLVYGTQVTMLGLILYNLLEPKGSPLDLHINIPVDVPTEVTIAQYLACVVSIFTARDFVEGIVYTRRRVSREGDYRGIGGGGQPPPLSWKWELSNLLRMSEGAFVIVVSFVFIVQSSTVIDLFLNFAGVAFVSELDDVTFMLAERGFFGEARLLAHEVSGCRVHTGPTRSSKGSTRKVIRIVLFGVIGLALLVGLSLYNYQQGRMRWACKSITITVGESKFASFRSYSGTYVLAGRYDRKTLYVQEQGLGAYLAYCRGDINRWTLKRREDDANYPSPCDDYELQSERTNTYDVTEINHLQYYTGDAVEGEIRCNDCQLKAKGDACAQNNGFCTEEKYTASTGIVDYQKRTCDCGGAHFGDSCQFQHCTELKFQEDEFPGYGRSFHPLYYNDHPLFVHDRPAYIQRNITSSGDFAALVYDGGRWLVIRDHSFRSWKAREGNIEEYLANDFNARSAEYDYDYISEPTHEGLPSNVPFRTSLTDGENYHLVGKLGEKEFVLECQDCGEDGPSFCMNSAGLRDDEICQEQNSTFHKGLAVRRCRCNHGFIGPLCQTRPVEGMLVLHLEHGAKSSCSICGEDNPLTVWDLTGLSDSTCTPFPREPLLFEGVNGTVVSRQLGLNLNESHFSVFVTDHGKFSPSNADQGSGKLLCSIQAGSKEIYSMPRNSDPEDQTQLDFAVLLNKTKDFYGEILHPFGIDCFTKSPINENECNGYLGNETLWEVYRDGSSGKSGLMRAWIKFDLKVTA